MNSFSRIEKTAAADPDGRTEIMVVDDNRHNLRLLINILAAEGYKVRPARYPGLALDSARLKPPGLILLDIRMPEMSGYELCERLKADVRTCHVPVIFISALNDPLDKVSAFSVGGVDYVTKPFHREEVLARIAAHLHIRKLRLRLEQKNQALEQENAERRRAESEILQQNRIISEKEETLRAIFNNAVAGIYLMGRDGKFLYANDRGATMLGCCDDELLSMTNMDITHPDDFEKSRVVLNHIFNGKSRNCELEKRLVRRDGSMFWGHLSASPLHQPDGTVGMAIGVIVDIDCLKQTELALKQAKDCLENTNKSLEERVREEVEKSRAQQQLLIQLESLGKLAAGIAHEVNQPLAGISMGLENILLKIVSGRGNADYLENKINVLLGHVDRIKHIIDHVRTFSREQAAGLMEPVDVNEVCRNALSMMAEQFRNHGISVEFSPGIIPGRVRGNLYRLEQVILNLISNARYAVDEKAGLVADTSWQRKISIRTREDEERICMEVEDNGTGISEKNMENIFDPFFTTKDPENGTGLGLSVSYGIVREINGEITVRSRQGDYTVMTVSLPKMKVQESA